MAPDPISRRLAGEEARRIADRLVANGDTPLDDPEGHREARRLAAQAGIEEEIEARLGPVSDG
jgi:hypothetical protein